jgi:hypothetical protein
MRIIVCIQSKFVVKALCLLLRPASAITETGLFVMHTTRARKRSLPEAAEGALRLVKIFRRRDCFSIVFHLLGYNEK